MTEAECLAVDSDPLWALSGQIRWYLERRTGYELVHATQIATDLDAALAQVSATLQELETAAEIASHIVDRRRCWGMLEQVKHLRNTERQAELDEAARVQRITDTNDELDAIRIRLGEMLSGTGIDVTSLRLLYPSAGADSRPDHLMLTTSNPASAAWLLERLRD